MTEYARRRPTVVAQIQFTGTNADEVIDWVGERDPAASIWERADGLLVIGTFHGDAVVRPSDRILYSAEAGFWPIDRGTFLATYVELDGEPIG